VLKRFDISEIFNTDQDARFTAEAFTCVLRDADVRISMDGKGRYLNNVFVERLWRALKYEQIYLNAYRDLVEARAGIARHIGFHKLGRPHQALGYQTRDGVYRALQPTAACKSPLPTGYRDLPTSYQCPPHPLDRQSPTRPLTPGGAGV
jgi:putative transposase